jgi:hypothetical protein
MTQVFSRLDTNDPVCVPHFMKPVGNNGNTTKVFERQSIEEGNEDSVRFLRWGRI